MFRFTPTAGGGKVSGVALGGYKPTGRQYYGTIPIFLRQNAIFDNGKGLWWYKANGYGGATIMTDSSDNLSFQVSGVAGATVSDKYLKAEKAFILAKQSGSAGATAPDVSNISFLLIPANTGAYTITDFVNGTDGQELILLFSDSNCTVQNSTGVKLAGAANFAGTSNDILTLVRSGSAWVEKSRSIN